MRQRNTQEVRQSRGRGGRRERQGAERKEGGKPRGHSARTRARYEQGAIVFGKVSLEPRPSLQLAESGKKRFFPLMHDDRVASGKNAKHNKWRAGEVVRARLVHQEIHQGMRGGRTFRRGLFAKPLESLGCFDGDINFLCSLSLRQQGLDCRFDADILAEVDREVASLVPYAYEEIATEEQQEKPKPKHEAKHKAEREDWRALPFVTIDGEDARDFDDAIHAEPLPKTSAKGAFRLRIAIADVAFYVQEGSPLDTVARIRGNSIYLPDRVVAMLPPRLSEELCSLQPQRERPCLMVELLIDNKGRVQQQRIARVVIKSYARITYDEVEKILADKKKANEKTENKQDAGEYGKQVKKLVVNLHEAWRALAIARDQRGALQIDRSEPYPVLKLAAGGRLECIAIAERHNSDARRIVEDFMIAANVAVASHLSNRYSRQRKGASKGTSKGEGKGEGGELGFVARNHEPPPIDKWQALQDDLGQLGLSSRLLATDRGRGEEAVRISKSIAEQRRWQLRGLLQFVQEKNSALPSPSPSSSSSSASLPAPSHSPLLVVEAVLRAQSQARYTTTNSEHFALALPNYCHFTSPIRRYADLLVHRALLASMQKDEQAEKKNSKGTSQPNISPPSISPPSAELCEHLIACERSAVALERATFQRIACCNLQTRLGEVVDGVVIRVLPFGFFVRLIDFAIEGIVARNNIDDYRFQYGREQALVGARVIAFGSRVAVEIYESDPISGRLELRLKE